MKKILSLIMVLFVLISSALTASATEVCVQDNALLLTDEERTEIIYECERLSQEHQVAILIHTTMSTDGEDIHTYAENFYYENASYEDGLVFVINLNNNEVGNRDFYTYYQGSVYDTFGDEAYNSDYGYVNSAVLPYLASENYYEAFQTYLELTESYLTGNSYEGDYIVPDNYGDSYYENDYYYEDDYYYESRPMSPVIKELIVIAVAAVVAFIVTSIMKSKMNTAVIKNEASDYVKVGSMNVTRRLDVFTHRHVTRTAKPKNNSSSGSRSGGGHSVGGGGGHSGGGGGKF